MSSNRSLLSLLFMALAFTNIMAQDRLCMQLSASSTTVCASCYQSYFDTTQSKCVVPTTAISNALTYSNATTATSCMANYYLSSNTCVAMTATNFANCKYGSYTTAGGYLCTQCNAGYSYTASQGTSTTTYSCATTASTNCTVANCSTCSTANFCMGCTSGFLPLAAGTCVSSTLTNCALASSATACSACSPGYYINAGACSLSATTVFGKILSLLLVFIL